MITIDLNKMSEAGQVSYLVDLVHDMRDILAGDNSHDIAQILAYADKAIADYERGQDIHKFMREHFHLINIGGK